jgi:hypothetical protein
VRVGVVGRHQDQVRVVLAVGAREHPGPAAAQRRGRDAGPFERLPRGLQHEPLLRVHGERFVRGDPEERGVEVGDTVHEPALEGGGGAPGISAVGTAERLEVPAAVGREGADGVPAPRDEVPQVLRGAHPAGEATGHADDRHRLVPAGLDLREPFAGLVQIRGHPLEVVDEVAVLRHRDALSRAGACGQPRDRPSSLSMKSRMSSVLAAENRSST